MISSLIGACYNGTVSLGNVLYYRFVIIRSFFISFVHFSLPLHAADVTFILDVRVWVDSSWAEHLRLLPLPPFHVRFFVRRLAAQSSQTRQQFCSPSFSSSRRASFSAQHARGRWIPSLRRQRLDPTPRRLCSAILVPTRSKTFRKAHRRAHTPFDYRPRVHSHFHSHHFRLFSRQHP